MKSNPKRNEGFTLIEVIISLAIIAIISAGVYNAYLLLISQTKDGEVKQVAALEGKEVLEEIKGTTFGKNGSNYSIDLNGSSLIGSKSDGIIKFSKGEDEEFVKEITFKRTQTEESKEDVESNDNQSSSLKGTGFFKLYVAKNQDSLENYITDDPNVIESNGILADKNCKLIIFVYLDQTSDENKYNIKIYDYKAQRFFERTNKDISKGLVMNFGKYKNSDGSVPSNVKINIYNRTANAHNIYIQKSAELNVEATIDEGEINLYNNRAEEGTEVGDLYDITVTVRRDNDILFTGHSKQNIAGWK